MKCKEIYVFKRIIVEGSVTLACYSEYGSYEIQFYMRKGSNVRKCVNMNVLY